MPLSRRDFILGTATAATAWPLVLRAQQRDTSTALFRHGVASGDPLTDRVVLWTRVTPPARARAASPVKVRWLMATDERLTRMVASGTAQAMPEHDFTVKIDASGLQPGRTYYYGFDASGERSPVGRTKTLPASTTERVRLASVSCSNYPAGYFNAYRCLANRDDLDAVVHLGDYIYEFANGVYGDGTKTNRLPAPAHEAVTLADYRARYATYRTDEDLQAAHARHPFIVVWDDHELANDAWSGGAQNHNPDEGDWQVRRMAAYRAYREWMPIRDSTRPGIVLYRRFRFGAIADLVMLDTRGLRDRQAGGADAAALADSRRSLLGDAQESWLFDELRSSQRRGAAWRLLGQQIMFARMAPPGVTPLNTDVWEGYPAARARVFDFLEKEQVSNVAILTGDIHSSWAIDVPRDPWNAYNAGTGAGSLAIELVTPAISSPPLFSDPSYRDRIKATFSLLPHLQYMDGDRNGYMLLDVTRDRVQADWYFIATVAERSDQEARTARFVCERGSSHLSKA